MSAKKKSSNNSVRRLAHVLEPVERRPVKPYSVTRLGHANSAAEKVILAAEEIKIKVSHCQRALKSWKTTGVQRQMTIETREELIGDVIELREGVRSLMRLLNPGRESEK